MGEESWSSTPLLSCLYQPFFHFLLGVLVDWIRSILKSKIIQFNNISFVNLLSNRFSLKFSLLHKRILISVLEEFQHQFRIDVEMTVVESKYFSILVLKPMLKVIIYIDFDWNRCRINVTKILYFETLSTSVMKKTDVKSRIQYWFLTQPMLNVL